MRDDLMIKRLVAKKIAAPIRVSTREARHYYEARPTEFLGPETYKMRMVVLPVDDPRERGSQLRIAQTIISRLDKRLESFASLAKRYSKGPHAAEGGDWGWVAKESLIPELGAALAKLEPGQVSPVIESDLGLHLLELEEKRPAATIPFDKAENRIRKQLVAERFATHTREWLKRLWGRATVVEFERIEGSGD